MMTDVGEQGPETVELVPYLERAGLFNSSLHPRGKGAQGGQFVAKGASGGNDTIGFDAKRGTGAGYGTGGKGDARVKQLQTALNKLGFKDAAGHQLLVDGKLGPRTTAAIKRLQRRLGMKADGLVTPALLKQVKGAAAKGGHLTPAKKTTGKRVHKVAPKKVAKKAAPKAMAPKQAAPPPKRTYSGHA